jgi:hypothetical protein
MALARRSPLRLGVGARASDGDAARRNRTDAVSMNPGRDARERRERRLHKYKRRDYEAEAA